LLKKEKQLLRSLSLLGIFLSVFLLHFNAKKRTPSIDLGTFSLVISLYILLQQVRFFSGSVHPVTAIFISAGFPVCLAGDLLHRVISFTVNKITKCKIFINLNEDSQARFSRITIFLHFLNLPKNDPENKKIVYTQSRGNYHFPSIVG